MKDGYGESVSDFRVSQRVELHPGLDLWMMGARYGTVMSLGRLNVIVELDRMPGSRKKIRPSRLRPL